MVLFIEGNDAGRYAHVLEQVYRLRHRVFVDELGWERLRKPDGREIDQFDTADAIHIVGWEQGKVVSYSRLLPTLKPHLLSDIYPEILDGAEVPRGPDIFEWTRCCIAPERRDSRSAMSLTARRLFVGVAEACVYLGVRAVTLESDPIWITRFLEIGWQVRPLALPQDYEGHPIVPIYADFDERTLAESRRILGISEPVLVIGGEEKRPVQYLHSA